MSIEGSTIAAWIVFAISIVVSVYGAYGAKNQFITIWKAKSKTTRVVALDMTCTAVSLLSAFANHVRLLRMR